MITVDKLHEALETIARVSEDDIYIEALYPRLEAEIPDFISQVAKKGESFLAAAILHTLLKDGAIPGESGNPIKDISDWITASGSNRVNVQIGCHFEEVAEMLEELVGVDGDSRGRCGDAYAAVKNLATGLKQGTMSVTVRNREDFLDAIADQIVTGTGAATMLKMDIVAGLARVNKSNWSKYVDGKPLFDENGKIKKGPNYVKADMKGLV